MVEAIESPTVLLALASVCFLTGGSAVGQSRDVIESAGTPEQAAAAREWPTYGHDSGGMRFSPLTQINTGNVSDLKVAWVYHMKQPGAGFGGPGGPPTIAPDTPGGPTGPPQRRGGASGDQAAHRLPQRAFDRAGYRPSLQRQRVMPLVINGTIYIGTPYGRVVALDPTTGKEVWTYQLPSDEPATRVWSTFSATSRRRRRL